ncbi:integrator complex subunit 3-like isoform X2 [Micropterus salmoides]|nr:integrator complex subunit 3-like isoform X2 [Micropterus salmoides]
MSISQVFAEFLALQMLNLCNQFYCELERCTPKLIALYMQTAKRAEALQRSSGFVTFRFSDLFALAEESEDSQTKPPKSRRKAPASSPRSRKGAALPTNNKEESASSSTSVRSPTSNYSSV